MRMHSQAWKACRRWWLLSLTLEPVKTSSRWIGEREASQTEYTTLNTEQLGTRAYLVGGGQLDMMQQGNLSGSR